MTVSNGLSRNRTRAPVALGLGILLLLFSLAAPRSVTGQSGVPSDRFHISITLGGYFLVGVGYSHWMEKHHAMEFTVFPFAYPGDGFPFGVRAGYAWVPSDEVWRAKLGANMTVLVRPSLSGSDRFRTLLGVTPGIQYDPKSDRSFRADLWMSYYLREKIFAPTGVELFYCWPK